MAPSEAHKLCGIEGCPRPHDGGPPMVVWGAEFVPCRDHRDAIADVIRLAWAEESVEEALAAS